MLLSPGHHFFFFSRKYEVGLLPICVNMNSCVQGDVKQRFYKKKARMAETFRVASATAYFTKKHGNSAGDKVTHR